jgi:8-oxo-dGTP pyrophosphatase MutT (NUDIX family)
MKKIRRGRNGLTKSEFLRREIEEETTLRLDEILENIAKREEEKCYPVPYGDVSTCPKNTWSAKIKHGWCSLFNKKCDNISKESK